MQRLELAPERERPRVVVYGESLGAGNAQSVLATEQDMDRLGVERVLWVGHPTLTGWRAADAGARQLHQPEEIATTDPDTRIWSFAHPTDPIHHIGPRDFALRPAWLDAEGVQGATPWLGWTPLVSGLHVVGDMVSAMGHGTRAEWGAHVHDYRGVAADLASAAFDLPATDVELARIEAATRRSELATDDHRRDTAADG